jgi:GT2 family glycosyltransferase
MHIAVCIVTYNNNENELKQWINSLELAIKVGIEEEKSLKISVFFIDNGHKTTTLDNKDYTYRIKSEGNIGYTAAMNLLIKSAYTDSTISSFQSANPDGAFHPYFFKYMIPFIKKFPDSIIESSQFPEEHPKTFDPFTLDTSWASGAASNYSRKIIDEVGFLDENFFMYCEDVDYSWRARLLGFSVKHCPNAKYGHHVINRQSSILTTKYMYESGRYLAFKWNNIPFAEWCERILIEQNLYIDTLSMPSYNLVFDHSGSEEIVDFKNHFYFSKGRW